MNREIKFRAWDNENKYMITSKQGIFTALRNSMNITVQDNGYYNNGDLLKPNKEKYTLMQYTGLKDKNGVEIYEGDIIEYKDSTGKQIEEVKFDKGCFYAGLHGGSSTRVAPKLINARLSKVIGNIYESDLVEKVESDK